MRPVGDADRALLHVDGRADVGGVRYGVRIDDGVVAVDFSIFARGLDCLGFGVEPVGAAGFWRRPATDGVRVPPAFGRPAGFTSAAL